MGVAGEISGYFEGVAPIRANPVETPSSQDRQTSDDLGIRKNLLRAAAEWRLRRTLSART
jgi:hypothetical protein